MAKKRKTQITGNVGLFYACYQLSCLGWNVLSTSKNTEGIDIVAYSQDAKTKIAIQVKALSEKTGVPPMKKPRCLGDFWIIIEEVATRPTAYIMNSEEVENSFTSNEKGQYWIARKQYVKELYKNAWSRLGNPET